jgi:hypothetical protein
MGVDPPGLGWPKMSLKIPVLALLTGGAMLVGSGCVFGCEFDADAWRDSRQARAFERYERSEDVVEDLVRCRSLLYGKSRAEVREMLGPPDKAPRNRPYWDYDIGVPGARSDYAPLEVVFDEEGRVEKVSVPGFDEPYGG